MKNLFILALIACTFALHAAAEIPEIDQKDLAKAIEAKHVTLIDVNGTETYAKGHIPGAIDFEADGKDLAKKLPADKGALIVAYCGGPQCMAYKDGAKAAEALGYTNVKHFKGGISGWKDSGAKVETVAANK